MAKSTNNNVIVFWTQRLLVLLMDQFGPDLGKIKRKPNSNPRGKYVY